MFLSLLPPCSVESSKKMYGQLAHTHTLTVEYTVGLMS